MSSSDVLFNLDPIKDLENGKRYKVSISLPISIGWIEQMKFVVKKGNDTLSFPIKHKENKDFGSMEDEYEVFIQVLKDNNEEEGNSTEEVERNASDEVEQAKEKVQEEQKPEVKGNYSKAAADKLWKDIK